LRRRVSFGLKRRLPHEAGRSDHSRLPAHGALLGRAILAFLGATLGIMSVMLIGTHGGPIFFPGTSLFHLLGYIGLFFSTVFILRVVIAISREGI
jgi:uncharacterized RDD family membrane protein YckC